MGNKLECLFLVFIALLNIRMLVVMDRMRKHKVLYDRVIDAVVKELLPDWRRKNNKKEVN